MNLIPEEIIVQYNLREIAHEGYVYIEIRKGMYGLPQAGILANKKLTKYLSGHGYSPTKRTPGLWTHHTNSIQFSLVVDDFGVKYTSKSDARKFIAILQELYTITIDWTGKNTVV